MTIDIAELRRLRAGAMSGQWEATPTGPSAPGKKDLFSSHAGSWPAEYLEPADAEWIAAMHNAAPELFDLAERAQAAENELGLHKLNRHGQCPMCYDAGYEEGFGDGAAAAKGTAR